MELPYYPLPNRPEIAQPKNWLRLFLPDLLSLITTYEARGQETVLRHVFFPAWLLLAKFHWVTLFRQGTQLKIQPIGI
ncbi:hypothetical protein A2208_02290 [Candidatus Woesebacteria bacterium RIFOXYA1_FULL_43_16]|nr:MAG: hypothetical protein A2208_02290 [Candidatus Woesebacteria bacterium RIFOXYA1_FULL_43_16]